jgi:hypothetical protein
MRSRKWIVTALAFVGAVGLTACSTLRTTTDYDRTADFGRFRVFDVEKVSTRGNDLLGRRIQSALESEFTGKGLQESDRDPDLLVVAHTRLDQETAIYTYNTGWGWGWGWHHWHGGPGWGYSTVEQIPVGTLIVDLVDAKSKQLVWRSTASDVIDPKATPEEREKNVTRAVSKMFETYPHA